MSSLKSQQLQKRVHSPLMIAYSDMWSSSNKQEIVRFCQQVPSDQAIYECAMKRTAHENFTDMIYLISSSIYGTLLPLSQFREISTRKGYGARLLGPENPKILHQAVQRLLLLFFQYHLPVVSSVTPPSSASFRNVLPKETDLFSFQMHKKKLA